MHPAEFSFNFLTSITWKLGGDNRSFNKLPGPQKQNSEMKLWFRSKKRLNTAGVSIYLIFFFYPTVHYHIVCVCVASAAVHRYSSEVVVTLM